jgi:hypothetical protein
LAEYQEFKRGEYPQTVLAFPAVPLRRIYHDAQVLTNEIMQYGGLNLEEATQVEQLWEKLLREYLLLLPNHRWIVAEGSSHFIQFARPDIVVQTLLQVVENGG